MKLTIKTLDQKTFQVEFDEARTVAELKEHLCQMPEIRGGGTLPQPTAAKQHLIYAGRVLDNGHTLQSVNIDERKFLVMMAIKGAGNATAATAATTKTAAAPDSASTKSSAQPTVQSGPSGEKKAEKEQQAAATPPKAKEPVASQQASTPPTTQAAATVPAVGAAQLLQAVNRPPTTELNDTLVHDIMNMGYPEVEVRRALAASYNNPDRAIEYLIDGIPEAAAAETVSSGDGGVGGGGSGGGSGGGGRPTGEHPLHFLRNDTRFHQMRRIIRQHPDMLGTVLAEIGKSNPELLAIIHADQNEFVRMLNSSGPDDDSDDNNTPAGAADGTGAPQQHVVQITLTAAEREAVGRLVALGFTRDMVLQAYIACEKNEEQTADFLFQQQEENQ